MSEYRITALKQYCLEEILQPIEGSIESLNVNFLNGDIENYTLVRLPVDTTVEQWITGEKLSRDVYNLVSRKSYSPELNANLENLGFFELVENKVKENNKNKILPDIDGIEEIKCLDCGSLIDRDTNTCVFSVQIQITYREA